MTALAGWKTRSQVWMRPESVRKTITSFMQRDDVEFASVEIDDLMAFGRR